MGVLTDELILHGLDLRVASLHLDEFLGIPIADKSDTDYAEAVRAHVRELGSDIDVHALHEGHHRNQGAGGKNDAQQCEKAAELVLPEGVDSNFSCFPKGCTGAESAGSIHAVGL
jgi:hypothetical protein